METEDYYQKGGPTTLKFACEIGADGYAPDAGSTVDLPEGLVGEGGN